MNSEILRPLIMETLVGVGVCIGGYLMVVEPLDARLRAARADTQRIAAAAPSDSPAGLKAEIESLAARAGEIDEKSKPARDELDVFSMLMTLAGDAGVRVEQLQQRELDKAAPSKAPLAPELSSEDSSEDGSEEVAEPIDSTIGYSLAVIGTYDQVLALVHGLRRNGGYTVIESARLAPAGDTDHPLIALSIDTLHWAFDTGGALATVTEARDALSSQGDH